MCNIVLLEELLFFEPICLIWYWIWSFIVT